MDGVFTVIIRDGLAVNDYRDPRLYNHPTGALAYEFKYRVSEPPRQMGQAEMKIPGMELQVIKPETHAEAMKMNPEMEHDDPNARRVAPKKTDEIAWKFTNAGRFEFACLIPGHRDAGMFGTVEVK
jgi:uncharacterized cupredoxin-like copper-binding protein